MNGQLATIGTETIEAEIVFLVRQAGQWPIYQTAIYFSPVKRRPSADCGGYHATL